MDYQATVRFAIQDGSEHVWKSRIGTAAGVIAEATWFCDENKKYGHVLVRMTVKVKS